MANKFQTYAEWKEAQKSSGSETASYRQFETYAQWKARQQTPEERAKYYQASGMDDFRKDFRTYASYGIVKDTANRQWAKNIQKQRDYFRRYASHFSQEQLTAFNEELDLYESIVNQRAEYAKLQPQIQEYQASQAAYQNYTEQRETMYGEEGLRADTQLYKNPNAMAALAQNGDPKAQELVRKRYASLGKLYGDEALGYQQAVDTQRETSGQIRELDKQIEALDANIETAEYYLNDGKTMYQEGGREEELRHVAAWKQERDALVKQRDTLAAKNAEATKTVDGGTKLSNTYAAYAVSEQEYKKANGNYNTESLATENAVHNIMNLFYGTVEYDDYVEAKEKDEAEAAIEHRTPTYDNLIALFRKSDFSEESIEGLISELTKTFTKRDDAWKTLLEKEALLRVKAKKNNDAWEYEMYSAMTTDNFEMLSKPNAEKAPEGDLGEVYEVLMADLPNRDWAENPHDEAAKLYEVNVDINGKSLRAQEIFQMSEGEKELFFYYCNTGEYEKAKLFLQNIADSLKYRYGDFMAELADYPVLREIYATATKADSGIRALGYGIGSMFTPMGVPDVTAEEYANSILYEKNKGTIAGFALGASQSIGNMIPSVLAYTIHPTVGLATTFFNARGNAYVEAKRNGYSEGQAWVYSTLVGASEAGLEKLLGGLGGMAKGLVPEKLSSMMPKVNGIVGKLCKEIPLNLLSEITEENIQNYLEPAFKMLVGAELEYDAPGYEDFIETTLATAISTVFFSIIKAPGMVEQERFNQQVGKWADAAMRAEKGSEIYQEGEKLRKMLDSGEDITVEYMRGISERIGVDKFASVGMSAETAKIIDNAKGWIGEIDPEFFMPENAETDVEDTIDAYLEEAQTASEENNPKKLIEASASVVKMLDAAKVNLDNALAQNLIDQDTYSRVQQRIEEARLGAKEILDLYLNPGTKTVGQATDIEGEMPEDSFGVKAYLDAGASEAEAMSAGAILDGILRGEITSETISNNKIKKLLANEEYGRNTISAALGVEVTREATASKQISAVRAAIAQYETSAAQRQNSAAGVMQQKENITSEGVMTNETEGKQSVRGDEGRKSIVDSGEQAGSVGESGSQRTADIEGTANITEAERKSLRKRKLNRQVERFDEVTAYKNASEVFGSEKYEGDIAEIPEEYYTEGMKEAAEKLAKDGVRVRYFKGTLMSETHDGRMRRTPGLFRAGTNEVWASVSSARFTPEQIAMHEYYHALVNMGKANVEQTVQEIKEKFSPEEFDRIVEQYLKDYRGAYEGDKTEDIYEELLADAYAGMNRFAKEKSAVQYQDVVRDQTQRGTKENERATRDTRGAPESRFRFAGKLSKTADMEALALAKEMQGQDVDRETILRETGWFIGADGKWRYEIDDNKARYKKGGDAQFLIDHPKYAEYQDLMAKALFGQLTKQEEIRLKELDEIWGREYARLSDRVKNGNATLENILQHEELFSAYPQLRDVKVEFAKMEGGEKGKYDRKNNTITISEELKNRPVTTLLHEIQHAIQKIEGFANGSSQEYWNRRMEEGFRKRWDNGVEMMPSELYRNTAGEIEARDAAARMNLTADERRKTFPNIGDENTVFAGREETSYSTKDDVLKLDGVDWMDNYSSIKDQLTKHSEKINKLDPVCIVEFNPGAKTKLSTAILETVNKIGGKNMKNKNVSFEFDEKGTGNILSHAKSAELQAAALAAPYVAKYGDLIAGQKNHESTGLTTLTFAAPVIINGDTVNVGVAIQFQKNGKPRAVNVEYQSGEKFVIDTKKVPAGLDSRVERYVQGTSLPTTGTNKSIRNDSVKVNMYDGKSASNIGEFDRENKDIRFSFDDEDYMLAVEAGDMEAAQKMVDEAAQAAGYIPAARYHQTSVRFNTFKTDKPVAAKYDSETPNGIFFKMNDHDIGIGGDVQMKVYLETENTLSFKNRAEANQWYCENVDGYEALQEEMKQAIKPINDKLEEMEDEYFAEDTTDERITEMEAEEDRLIEEMKEVENRYRGELRELLNDFFLDGKSGYDSIELEYDGHRWVNGKRENVHTVIVFNAEQAKSADPVTYDDNGNVIPLSERFNSEKTDIRYSFEEDVEALDEDYMLAVEAGDMDAAQKMVDEAAQAAGYTVKAIHGTTKDFVEFGNKGTKTEAKSAALAFWFSDSESTARAYSTPQATDVSEESWDAISREADKRIKEFEKKAFWTDYSGISGELKFREDVVEKYFAEYLPVEHDEIISEGYDFGFDGILEWYNKHFEKGRLHPVKLKERITQLMDAGIIRSIANEGEYGAKPKVMNVFLRGNLLKSADIRGTDQEKVERIRRAKRAGKDGVVFKNIADGGEVSTHYAIFDPKSIKSADPVTYDDKGKVIPLSERFNQEKTDIRYSFEEDVEALDEEYRQVIDSEPVPHRTAGDLKREIRDTIERGSRQEKAQEPTATVTRTVPAGEFYPEGTTVTHTYGRGKPFYSKTTNLSPKEALFYLQAATGMKWRVEPMRKGLWKAVMTGEKLDTVYAPPGYNKAVKELRTADKNAQVPTVKEFAEQKLAEGWRDPNAPTAATVHTEGIKKSDFTASKALNKIGVKIDGSVTDYSITQNMRSAEEARRRIVREIYKAEKYWDATKAEKQVAVDIANGDLSYFDIPDSCRFQVVSEIAALRMDERMAGNNLVQQRRYAIRDSLLEKAMDMFPSAEKIEKNPKLFNPSALLTMNYRTAQRNMMKIFGDELGAELYEYYFAPVTRNEASRQRWMNEQFDKVRKFEGSDGKTKKLTKAESAYVHEMLDLEGYVQKVNESEKKDDIIKAAQELKEVELVKVEYDSVERAMMGVSEDNEEFVERQKNVLDLAVKYNLDKEQTSWMIKYAQWIAMQEGYSGKVDEERCKAAAAVYRQLFDDYFEAINDFLVAHGANPIGKIEGYTPHMTSNDKVNLLSNAMEKLGFNANATRLPAEIAGRTEEFRPSRRWTPFFEHRMGDKTDYDIVKGFESYVTYISDVLFHMDDIQKIRSAEEYLRQGVSGTFETSIQEAIDMSRSGNTEDRIDYLKDLGRIRDAEYEDFSKEEINEAFDTLIKEMIGERKENTRYSDMVVWLQNYANVLAGKQFGGDRGTEHMGGRNFLTFGNKINAVFARANVAGNLSSALNQMAQLPTLMSERRATSIVHALGEFITGKLREFSMESDFLTSKKGVSYITKSVGEMTLEGIFKPTEFMDSMLSTLVVRSAYLDAVKDGMSHEAAMRFADNYGQKIMADRSKGAKPLAFHSKGMVKQMLNMFQIEALNSWEHISQDLPRDFRQIAQDGGKAKAARALALTIVKYLIAAFLLNRWTEEEYGGTPAPFDLFGMTANFIASGNGLTTNEWIKRTINKVTGVDLFEESNYEEFEKFDWGAAVEDTTYNLSNEIPFVSNISGMLGLGDRTLPTALPGITDAVTGIYDAASENGVFSDDTLLALVDLLKSAVPGGRQISKTVGGIRAAVEGGKMNGTGENEKLQYVTDDSVLGIIQQVLFGVNATEESRAHYASGESGLTARQTQLWKEITEQGGDGKELFELIQGHRRIKNDDSLAAAERSEQQRNAIAASSFTDEQKAYIYSVLFGDKDGTAQDEPFGELMDAGMSWDEITEMFNEYKRIYNDDSIGASEQTTEFQYWIDKQKYTKKQREIINDSFRYGRYSSVDPNESNYSKLVAQGVSPEDAKRIVANTTASDGESVKQKDKVDAILKQNMSDEKTYAALGAVLNESTYDALTEARAAGISCRVFLDFRSKAEKMEADKDPDNPEKTIAGSKKEKVVELIDSLQLTEAQKDVLYLMYYAESGIDDTPWH